ncbi:MAG: hypothetical protein CRN43_02015 [Candidatus Nephrothrix sp. EaCA]|nr:MAG: hypothetical protein CRN43_02015 [Candidatus Nephrothrix sp. EaCA]
MSVIISAFCCLAPLIMGRLMGRLPLGEYLRQASQTPLPNHPSAPHRDQNGYAPLWGSVSRGALFFHKHQPPL